MAKREEEGRDRKFLPFPAIHLFPTHDRKIWPRRRRKRRAKEEEATKWSWEKSGKPREVKKKKKVLAFFF